MKHTELNEVSEMIEQASILNKSTLLILSENGYGPKAPKRTLETGSQELTSMWPSHWESYTPALSSVNNRM